MESLGKSVNNLGYSNGFFQYVMGDIGPDFQHASLQILASDPRHPAIDIWVEEDQQCLKEMAFAQALNLKFEQGNPRIALGVLTRFSPRTLGAMMALYELKALVLAKQFQLNPFDQPGVEDGKRILQSFHASQQSLHTFSDWKNWYLSQSE